MTLFSWSWLVHLIPWRVYFWLRLTLCVPLSVPSFDAVTVLNEEYQRKTLLTRVCATGRFEIGCRKQQGRSREKTICWAARTFCGMGMYSPYFMEIQKPLPPFIEPMRREEAKTFVSNQPRFQGSLLPVGKENLGTRLVSNLAYTRRGLQNKSVTRSYRCVSS